MKHSLIIVLFVIGIISCSNSFDKVIVDEKKETSSNKDEQFEPKSNREFINYLKEEFEEYTIDRYTFVQETIQYGGPHPEKSIWYEAIEYPSNFRMDFGDPSLGNSNLFVNDSLFAFRDYKLVGERFQPFEFLLFEGGIHHLSIDSIMNKFQPLDIDSIAFHITEYQGKRTFVIGAEKDSLNKVQSWIDFETGLILRSISKISDNDYADLQITSTQTIDNHIFPDTIDIYLKGNLIQREKYLTIQVNPTLPDNFFKTKSLSKDHWFIKKD